MRSDARQGRAQPVHRGRDGPSRPPPAASLSRARLARRGRTLWRARLTRPQPPRTRRRSPPRMGRGAEAPGDGEHRGAQVAPSAPKSARSLMCLPLSLEKPAGPRLDILRRTSLLLCVAVFSKRLQPPIQLFLRVRSEAGAPPPKPGPFRPCLCPSLTIPRQLVARREPTHFTPLPTSARYPAIPKTPPPKPKQFQESYWTVASSAKVCLCWFSCIGQLSIATFKRPIWQGFGNSCKLLPKLFRLHLLRTIGYT